MAMAIVEAESIPEGLAFDDMLLRPGMSAVMPSATDIGAQLTRTIRLKLPIISAAEPRASSKASAMRSKRTSRQWARTRRAPTS